MDISVIRPKKCFVYQTIWIFGIVNIIPFFNRSSQEWKWKVNVGTKLTQNSIVYYILLTAHGSHSLSLLLFFLSTPAFRLPFLCLSFSWSLSLSLNFFLYLAHNLYNFLFIKFNLIYSYTKWFRPLCITYTKLYFNAPVPKIIHIYYIIISTISQIVYVSLWCMQIN